MNIGLQILLGLASFTFSVIAFIAHMNNHTIEASIYGVGSTLLTALLMIERKL